MHKVFISYHHANDQYYKEQLVAFAENRRIFIDCSVDTGDIDENLADEQIRQIIRDEYLKESSVTILLVGTATKNRKHVDWELYSSMYDGAVNKKSGIIVVNLPSINCQSFRAGHLGEKQVVFPEQTVWESVNDRAEYERRYPYMPDRIIDNLLNGTANISVVPWSKVLDEEILRFMIDKAYEDREKSQYDLSRPMRKRNT